MWATDSINGRCYRYGVRLGRWMYKEDKPSFSQDTSLEINGRLVSCGQGDLPDAPNFVV